MNRFPSVYWECSTHSLARPLNGVVLFSGAFGMIEIKSLMVVVAAISKKIPGRFSVKAVELLAVREGLLLAGQAGIPIFLFERDALRMVEGLTSSFPSASLAPIYLDIKSPCKSGNLGTCLFIPRNGNKVAYCLAGLALNIPSDRIWTDCMPLAILLFTLNDLYV
ncbi:hypothetical protein TorRG33x02_338570 [Trema orientale]|uniref:RNase H type-1 domain-containing protein n=1 Tax=Trema orientale TaxID=63057 RepID=A0A2P5AXH6_TREOI|nr:hypothetical protein TorRG33x02_338570 [Trema orientale]